MSISTKQAREALYPLEKCAKEALLVDYMRETDGFHASELERYFAKAAEALGYSLVRVDGNVLHIHAQGGKAMMRRPSDDATALAWYWQALNDASLHLDLTIDYNLPQCGWFQTRLARKGPMVPARIWLEQEIDITTGELISDEVLKCEILGRETDPIDGWQRCAANPISKSLFDFLTATVKWAGQNAPDEPMANPYRSTDWLRVPNPTFEPARS